MHPSPARIAGVGRATGPRAGAALSAAAHAAVIGLAVWAVPWLRAGSERPAPVVRVSLVSGAELAALTPPPAPPPAPVVLAVPEPAVIEPVLPPVEAPLPEDLVPESLAPAFDPEAALGIPADPGTATVPTGREASAPAPPPVQRVVQPEPGAPAPEPPATRLLRSTPPMPRPGTAAETPVAEAAPEAPTGPAPTAAGRQADAAGLAYQVAMQTAIRAAQAYPPAERDAGVAGTTRIEVSVARDGRLLQARVAQSSGSEALDRASLAAARRARLPAAPAGLAGDSFRFEVGLAYGPDAP